MEAVTMLVRGFLRIAYARPQVKSSPRREPCPVPGRFFDAAVGGLLLVLAVIYFMA